MNLQIFKQKFLSVHSDKEQKGIWVLITIKTTTQILNKYSEQQLTVKDEYREVNVHMEITIFMSLKVYLCYLISFIALNNFF